MVSRRKFSQRFAGLVFAALLVAPAHAIVATTGSSTPIDTTYAYLGYVDTGGGSAVAVGPHTFLTANHNIGGGDLGHTITMSGVTYSIAGATAAPDIYSPTYGSSIHVDLTLVTVNATLPGYYSIGTGLTSTSVTMTGYGLTGSVSADGQGYDVGGQDLNLHSGTNTLSFAQDYSYGSASGPILGSFRKNAGDAAITHGDSGGGWFQGNTLIGISSFTGSTDSSITREYGFASSNGGTPYFASAAIDLTDPRLRSFLAQANPVPEPATLAALGLGTLGILRRRRRN